VGVMMASTDIPMPLYRLTRECRQWPAGRNCEPIIVCLRRLCALSVRMKTHGKQSCARPTEAGYATRRRGHILAVPSLINFQISFGFPAHTHLATKRFRASPQTGFRSTVTPRTVDGRHSRRQVSWLADRHACPAFPVSQ